MKDEEGTLIHPQQLSDIVDIDITVGELIAYRSIVVADTEICRSARLLRSYAHIIQDFCIFFIEASRFLIFLVAEHITFHQYYSVLMRIYTFRYSTNYLRQPLLDSEDQYHKDVAAALKAILG